MKTVRFVRDTDPQREGGPGFLKDQVRTLKPGSARRWVLRGAAEYVTTPKTEPHADAYPVERAADPVEGADGAGAGERSESAADATESRGSGEDGAGSSGGHQQRRGPGKKK